MFSKGKRVGLALSLFCLFSFSAVGVRAEDFGVYKEGKGVVLEVKGQKFSVGVGTANWSWDWLRVDEVTVDKNQVYAKAFCTSFYDKGTFKGTLAAEHIQEIKVILDKEDEKVVYIKAKAYNQSEKKIVEPYCIEMNLRVKKGFPCLFVHQRMTNPTDSPKNLSFTSYARSFSTYAGADLKRNKIIRTWNALAKNSNWLWAKREITEKTEGTKGLGIISFASDDSFGTDPRGHIYFGDVKGTVEEGDCLESKWAVMAAEAPEEVKALYTKIKDMELGPLLRPGNQIVMFSNSRFRNINIIKKMEGRNYND